MSGHADRAIELRLSDRSLLNQEEVELGRSNVEIRQWCPRRSLGGLAMGAARRRSVDAPCSMTGSGRVLVVFGRSGGNLRPGNTDALTKAAARPILSAMGPLRQATTGATTDLRTLLVRHLEHGDLELPILPEAATQVLAACRDDRAASRQVASTLERDPALASHVLRVANSAAYASHEPIVSLAQAVGRLGFAAVGEITMAVALKASVFRVDRHESLARPVWSHSAAAASWAREIARQGRRNVESAFLSGLLHDIGRPVIVQATVALERAGKLRFADDEIRAAADALHAEFGAALARRWALPEWIVEAILFHHDPAAAQTHGENVRITALADRLAHWVLGETLDSPASLASDPLVASLDFYPDEFEQLLRKRDEVVGLARALGG